MHVHGTHLNPAATNLYSAVAAEKAAAAKRAAEVRKKLKDGASQIEAELDADVTLAISGESNEDSRQRRDNKNPRSSPKKQNADEEPPADPISVWG
jgi:hypothetical protein